MLDWHISDIAESEQPLVTQPVPTRRLRDRGWFIACAMLIGCLLAGTGLLLWLSRMDQAIRVDLNRVLMVEDRAWERTDPALLKVVLDPHDSAWMTSAYLCFFSHQTYPFMRRDVMTSTLESYEWLPSEGTDDPSVLRFPVRLGTASKAVDGVPLLMARVLVQGTATGQPFAYREIRFYRSTGKGEWLRTAPDSSVWGPRQESSTRFIRISYTARDAGPVRAVLSGIDDLVLQASTDLGIAPPDEQLNLRISEQLDAPFFLFDVTRPGSNVVSSPTLYPEATDLPPGTILRWDIVNRVASWLVQRATVGAPATGLEEQIRIGLFDWIRRDWLNAPLSTDSREVARLRSWSLARPLLVDGLLAARRYTGDSRRCLGQLGQDVYGRYIDIDEKPRSLLDPTHYAIIDYIVRAYGRQRLAIMARSLCCASTWDQLLHMVLGVDRATFESGLRQDLRVIRNR